MFIFFWITDSHLKQHEHVARRGSGRWRRKINVDVVAVVGGVCADVKLVVAQFTNILNSKVVDAASDVGKCEAAAAASCGTVNRDNVARGASNRPSADYGCT